MGRQRVNRLIYRIRLLINRSAFTTNCIWDVRKQKTSCFWLLYLLASPIVKAQESPTNITDPWRVTIEKAGDYAQFVPNAVSLITVCAKRDRTGLLQWGKSTGMDIAATLLLKYAIDKPRPSGSEDGHAFPSGHTSFAFQGASFLQRRYGWKLGVPAYGLAAFVGFSRVAGAHRRHDVWDVIGGAMVGIASTYFFTTPYIKEHVVLRFRGGHRACSLEIVYKL